MSSFMFGHQKSCDVSHVVFVIPGCPAVFESWKREITPLLNALLSTTTSLVPFHQYLPVLISWKGSVHSSKVAWCSSCWVITLSSIRVVRAAFANISGGKTTTSELSFVFPSWSLGLDMPPAWFCVPGLWMSLN